MLPLSNLLHFVNERPCLEISSSNLTTEFMLKINSLDSVIIEKTARSELTEYLCVLFFPPQGTSGSLGLFEQAVFGDLSKTTSTYPVQQKAGRRK